MFSKLSMLAMAGAASVTAFATGVQAQPTLTQSCAFKAGPLGGKTIDYSSVPGAVAVPVGNRCADMQGSSGVAVAEGNAWQIPGRFYSSPGYYSSPGAPMAPPSNLSAGFGQRCRFTSGPASGTTMDYSHTLGALPQAIGARCADGASSGVVVGPGM
jgi:hypothetical protein